jgi:putative ABC transport system permease protein
MSLPLKTAWAIARRDLNARFRGLRLLVVCIFLGTAALAAIGTLTSAIARELASSGQELLGGDLQIEVWQRTLRPEEVKALSAYGTISSGYRMQAMASTPDAAAPIELKAVDAKWPMFGTLTLADGRSVGAPKGKDAWIAQTAIERLGIKVGDSFKVGTVTLRAAPSCSTTHASTRMPKSLATNSAPVTIGSRGTAIEPPDPSSTRHSPGCRCHSSSPPAKPSGGCEPTTS